jgi:hypothetical protein
LIDQNDLRIASSQCPCRRDPSKAAPNDYDTFPPR